MDGRVCNPLIKICWKNFFNENEPWLLIGIPSRDPFLVTQYLVRHSVSSDQHVKKLMSPRKGLHVLMQCYMRQHFVDRHWLHENPGGHASWREPTTRKFTKESTTYFVKGPVCDGMFRVCSENKGFFTNSWRIKIALESYFEEHAQEVWDRTG